MARASLHWALKVNFREKVENLGGTTIISSLVYLYILGIFLYLKNTILNGEKVGYVKTI